MEGWKCPACGGAHAPDVKTCPVFAPPQSPGFVTDPLECTACAAARRAGRVATCGCYRPARGPTCGLT